MFPDHSPPSKLHLGAEHRQTRLVLAAQSSSSRAEDPEVAVRDLAKDLGKVGDGGPTSAAVFFATEEYGPALERIGRKITAVSGVSSVVGCGAEGVLPSEDLAEGSRGISALTVSGLTGVERFFLPGLRGHSEEHGREIGRLAANLGTDEPVSVLLFADTYNLAPDELLSGIGETAAHVPVIGAGATESGTAGETSVAAHGVSAANAISGLVLRGVSMVPVRTPVYTPVGTWWTVTSAAGNRIDRLDDEPALLRVLEALPESFQENAEEALGMIQVAVAEPDGTDSPLLRPIVGADPDTGALMIGDEIVSGARLALAASDPVVARRALDVGLERLGGIPDLAGVLYFHSALGGRSPYGHPGLDIAYLRRELGAVPVAGFGSYVTFAPRRRRNRFHHFSGLLVGLAPAGSISEEEIWGR